jgi:hypothetical protein
VLFIDPRCYHEKVDYEESIVQYYISPTRRDGLSVSMKHLLRNSPMMAENVYNNMEFYVEPIKSTVLPIFIQNLIGPDFHPSSIALLHRDGKLIGNVRFVNYQIDSNGAYSAFINGVLAGHHQIQTENMYIELDSDLKITKTSIIDPSSIGLPSISNRIVGFEDIRLYTNSSDELCFTATSAEHASAIRIVQGRYDTNKYVGAKVLESPFNAGCEKNWIAIPDTDDIIYGWNPLRVGKIEDSALNIHTSHNTPWFFQHLRGSSVPFQRGSELWMIVHYVKYSTPRKYFHCMMVIDAVTYKPLRVSLPFVFEKQSIEYCLGAVELDTDTILCSVSHWDSNPSLYKIQPSSFQWMSL